MIFINGCAFVSEKICQFTGILIRTWYFISLFHQYFGNSTHTNSTNTYEKYRQKIQKHRRARGSKKEDIHFSGEDNVLRDLLGRKIRLRAHVHKIDDIAALLRLVDEFKINVTVDHAGDVHRPGIFRELKKRKIPVIYGPIDSFAYKVELKHEDWRNVRYLLESGVEYGLMTDHPVTLARQLLLQTRWFLRAGLSKQQAIELLSRRNSKILGLDDRLGTLEKGKWASFIGWNGDPFDLASYPVAAYGEGELLYSAASWCQWALF